MRRPLLLLSLFLGLLAGMTSCQTDEASSREQSLSPTATLTVTIPQGIETKAAADYGTGAKINRCILEIYRNGNLYGDRQVVAVTDNQATFNGLQLVASQTYDFVLWADCGDGTADKYYNTTTLKAVTVNSENKEYTGNDDGFDAFYAKESYTVEGSFTKEITLKRPFGQLNVKTNDLGSIAHDDLKPARVKVSFASVPSTFNALTGAAENPRDITYTASIEDADAGELTVDYILATPEEAELADFTMTFLRADGTEIVTNDRLRNIPIRRNYRTNVSGNLITKQGSLNVTIDSEFETPDHYWGNELVAAATNGGTITLQSDVVFDENMPALVVESGKTLIINLNGHSIECKVANQDAIKVNGGTLVVNGEGEIKATGKGSNYAIWAVGDAQVTINGGNYLGCGACIQAKDNAHIEINDGYFRVNMPYEGVYFVLNLQDNHACTITVKGGKFENFNPSKTGTEPIDVNDNFVAEGFSAVKISDTPAPNGVYEVIQGISVGNMDDLQTAIEMLSTQGGNVVIAESADIDISSLGAALEINYPTTLVIDGNLTSSVDEVQIVNYSELTIKGSGTADMSRRIVENKGTLTVEGGTYTTCNNYGGTAFWNNDPNAVMTLNNVTVNASYFAVAGSGEIHINGGHIKSTSSNKYGSWAYCIRAQEGSTMTIKDAVVEGVHGCIASIEGSHITLENVQVSAKNSEPGRQDAFYALYAASLGVIEVISGEFYSDRIPCSLVSDDDQVGTPLGEFILKGGKYSSYPQNDNASIWQPEAGYRYVETGDETYPYAIVQE